MKVVWEHMEQLPAESSVIEIGLGSRQFATALGIKEGVEPVREGFGEGLFVIVSALK